MKKFLFLFAYILFMGLHCKAQTNFESGYIILNNGNRTECLIKNMDWIGSPTTFEYKLSEESEVKIGTLANIKEFGSGSSFKYLKATIMVDQSSDKVGHLNYDRNPVMKEETLFLKILVSGNATLYFSEKENNRRYFYQLENGEIQNLIYKRYYVSSAQVARNNRYKQQLATYLKCGEINEKTYENLEYKSSKLIPFFKKYNLCVGSEAIVYESPKTKQRFHLSVRPGVTFSSISLTNPYDNNREIDFGQNTGFRLGIEVEYILPFRNNKWSFIVEPNYRKYEAEANVKYVDYFTIKKFTDINIKYSAITTPMQVRHYFFINNKASIFINAGIVLDVVLEKEVFSSNENRFDYNEETESDLESLGELGFIGGIGFNYSKFSVEANFMPPRDIFQYNQITTNYKSFSLVLGYRIF